MDTINPVRIGIIDLGTNSVRFDIHQVEPSGEARLLHREKLMIRLGQGVFLTQKLDPQAIKRTLQVFSSFQETARAFHTEKVLAFGTSALREASDSHVLVQSIHEKTSIRIRVISGEEEASLIAAGILSHIPNSENKGYFGLIDIGGGSTEISICWKKKIVHSASFPLGTARLQQIFLNASTPLSSGAYAKSDPILALRGYIKSTLLSKTVAEDWPPIETLIGSSGTVRALQKILRKTTRDDRIQRRSLSKLVKVMKSMNQQELLSIPGMEEKRSDMILAGAILLEECMEVMNARFVMGTDYSLRDGILENEVRQITQQNKSRSHFTLHQIQSKTKQLGYNDIYASQLAHLAATLFERTYACHQLENTWKIYLQAAALFLKTGKVISPLNYESHSFYIARNADIPGMEKWESEFIANLCLYQDSPGLSKLDLGFAESRSSRNAFVKLLALLRLADALHREHKSQIVIEKVRILNETLKIKVRAHSPIDLQLIRFEQKKSLFEEVFQCHVTAFA